MRELGFHVNPDGDTGGALAGGGGVEVHGVSEMDRGFEIDAFDRGRDPAVYAVATGLDESGLVDVAQDHTAEDRAVLIRVAGHHDDPEGEGSGGGHSEKVARAPAQG